MLINMSDEGGCNCGGSENKFSVCVVKQTCHGGKEEAVAVSRVQRGNLAIDLSSGAHGEDGGRSQEEGDGSSVHGCV